MRTAATLEPVRFGEFLRDRHLITDEQWLAALAEHWSSMATGAKRRRIGATIAAAGYLAKDIIEAEAKAFHDGLDVVEVDDLMPRSERTTTPVPMMSFSARTL